MKSRFSTILMLIALSTMAFFVSNRATANAQSPVGFEPNAEAEFTQLINDLRTRNGLAPLIVDQELVNNARNWCTTMSNSGGIFHAADQSIGLSSSWALLGENVGVGPNVGNLFDAFVASPTHYANIMRPEFDYIGVGVYWSGDRMWTTQRYRDEGVPQQLAETAPPDTEPPSTEPPSTEPPTTEPPTTEPPTTEPPTTEPPTTLPTTTAAKPTTTATARPAQGEQPVGAFGNRVAVQVSASEVNAIAEAMTEALRFA